jgi:hypothetical protein
MPASSLTDSNYSRDTQVEAPRTTGYRFQKCRLHLLFSLKGIEQSPDEYPFCSLPPAFGEWLQRLMSVSKKATAGPGLRLRGHFDRDLVISFI